MLLSVIVPARNEEGSLPATLPPLHRALREAGIDHEIVVVDDHSTDGTAAVLASLSSSVPTLRSVRNGREAGFGHAVRWGLEAAKGDAAAIVMADGSDSPGDLVRFFLRMEETGADCVFGSRFTLPGSVSGYPPFKLFVNRLGNLLLRAIFRLPCDDLTNAFKLYRRRVLDGVAPLSSRHFELTVELPLKAVVRGFSVEVVPNSWRGRKEGVSKFRILRTIPRYLPPTLACLREKVFPPPASPGGAPPGGNGGGP